jgi:hypothetical protein
MPGCDDTWQVLGTHDRLMGRQDRMLLYDRSMGKHDMLMENMTGCEDTWHAWGYCPRQDAWDTWQVAAISDWSPGIHARMMEKLDRLRGWQVVVTHNRLLGTHDRLTGIHDRMLAAHDRSLGKHDMLMGNMTGCEDTWQAVGDTVRGRVLGIHYRLR